MSCEDIVESDEEEEVSAGSWPPLHELASIWEENSAVRGSLRQNKRLLIWPKKELTGVATIDGLAANLLAVQDALKVWASHAPSPRAPPIDWLREEARHFFT